MGFFTKEEVPPAPDMSGVIAAGKEVTAMASDIAKQTMDWATKEIADNKTDIKKYTDQITADSDTSRGMIDKFQDLSNKQLGLADGAVNIRDAAMGQAEKLNAVGDTQGAIQQQQLGNQNQQLGIQQDQLANQKSQLDFQDTQKGVQDVQLKFQQDLQQIQQDFRGDQQAIQQKADELYSQYQKTYPAAMEKFAADAAAYDTPERRAQAGAEAQAGVGMQFQAARDAATRQLEAFGVKPSDTRFAALDLGTRIKEAAQKASADRMAQLQTEQQGFSLRDAAIKQGSVLPGQSTAMTGQANTAGSNVNAAGQTAVGAGNTAVGAGNTAVGAGNTAATFGNVANQAGAVGAQFGSLANQAGANQISAGTGATSAINAATGATNAATGATSGATQAQTGALAANTGAAAETGAAGDLTNRALTTETGVAGAAAPYVNAATGGVNSQTAASKADYDNKLAEFKAEQTNTSGLGALAGAIAGPLIKAGMGSLTGGASLAGDLVTDASGTGTAKGLNLQFAEGGAIPMSTSPSQGQQTDDVKAMLNAGEFIMPKDVTSWYGEKFFQQLIAKAQNEKSKATAKPAVGPMPPGPAQVASGPSAMQGAV